MKMNRKNEFVHFCYIFHRHIFSFSIVFIIIISLYSYTLVDELYESTIYTFQDFINSVNSVLLQNHDFFLHSPLQKPYNRDFLDSLKNVFSFIFFYVYTVQKTMIGILIKYIFGVTLMYAFSTFSHPSIDILWYATYTRDTSATKGTRRPSMLFSNMLDCFNLFSQQATRLGRFCRIVLVLNVIPRLDKLQTSCLLLFPIIMTISSTIVNEKWRVCEFYLFEKNDLYS